MKCSTELYLQLFYFIIMLHSKVIFKSLTGPDNIDQKDLQALG